VVKINKNEDYKKNIIKEIIRENEHQN